MQELTKAQQDYFRNSTIREDNGDLLVVYNAVIPREDGALEYAPTCCTDPSYLKVPSHLDPETKFTAVAMYVNAQKPFEYKGNELREYGEKHGAKTNAELIEHLRTEGYDCLVTTNSVGVKAVTVFQPNQIKAINNMYPTKSDFSLDNSKEYNRINFSKMTVNEHLDLARQGKDAVGKAIVNRARKRDEQVR